MSALWVFLTTANALTLIINNKKIENDFIFYFGVIVWVIGIVFEIVADEQKRIFRLEKNNESKFISSGLWSISRHPNYFGDLVVWISIFTFSISSENLLFIAGSFLSPLIMGLIFYLYYWPYYGSSYDAK